MEEKNIIINCAGLWGLDIKLRSLQVSYQILGLQTPVGTSELVTSVCYVYESEAVITVMETSKRVKDLQDHIQK